jgi:hypothetical protein
VQSIGMTKLSSNIIFHLHGEAMSNSKLKGIGYQAKPATIRWKNPNGTDSGVTTIFNPNTGDPFGTGPAGTLNEPVFDARYGGSNRPKAPDGTSLSLPIDAETILGVGTRAMQMAVDLGEQFGDGWTGTLETHDMKVSPRDAHDFSATKPGDFHALMARFGIGTGAPGNAGSVPGTPAIVKLESPSPGLIKLVVRTRLEPYAFEVRVTTGAGLEGVYSIPVQPHNRPAREIDLEVPVSGTLEVVVRAKLGNTPGAWSSARKVTVEARAATGPVSPQPEPGPVIPKPVDPSPEPDSSLTPAPQRVDELWSWINTDVWPLLRPVAVLVIEFARGVLARWKSR